MHELFLAQGILQAALDEAQRRGRKRIREIHAKVRESSHHLEAASLQTCLEAIAKNTLADGAEVKIEVIPPTLRCRECNFTFPAQRNTLVCPHCKAGKLEEIDSEELYFESIT